MSDEGPPSTPRRRRGRRDGPRRSAGTASSAELGGREVALPRKPELDEARLHDQRPEVWLTAPEIAAIRDACSRPVSPQSRAAVRESRWASYKLALVDDGAVLGAEEAVKLADSAVRDAAEARRREAAMAWAKTAGLRWRDVAGRFGFEW